LSLNPKPALRGDFKSGRYQLQNLLLYNGPASSGLGPSNKGGGPWELFTGKKPAPTPTTKAHFTLGVRAGKT